MHGFRTCRRVATVAELHALHEYESASAKTVLASINKE